MGLVWHLLADLCRCQGNRREQYNYLRWQKNETTVVPHCRIRCLDAINFFADDGAASETSCLINRWKEY